MKNIALFLWQLPQNLLGIIVLIFYWSGVSYSFRGRLVVVNRKISGGISLGCFIIIPKYPFESGTSRILKHEYGHSLQSMLLGWLYLVGIGIPSVTGRLVDTVFHRKWTPQDRTVWYYNLPWEKWADKLGGVI